MKKQTLLDLKEYSTYLDLFSNLSLLNSEEIQTISSNKQDKYQVENLGHLMEILKHHEIEIDLEIQQNKNKRFSYIIDKKGNKIELWEPVQ
ncbi:MAG: hypothetical protein L7U23_06900 [Crocinitomicaceae bacterium]|jgi:hypothetical protein|nr:hypothetical protein [Crocinitomicaceae bacterium]